MKNRLFAWLLCLVMLLSVGAVAAAETNPNAGLGYYPGTAEKGAISVECSTMSVMNTTKMTYNTELGIARHKRDKQTDDGRNGKGVERGMKIVMSPTFGGEVLYCGIHSG